MKLNVRQKTRLHLLAMVGVPLGIILAMLCRFSLEGSPSPAILETAPPPAEAAPAAPSVADIVGRHFEWAAEQEIAGLAPRLVTIQEFFAEARQGTRAFAEDALGFDSKWKYVSDYLAGGEEHRRFLEERFAARIFAAEDLEKVVQYSVSAYLNHLDNVDSALLVNLQADLEGLPTGTYSEGISHAAIENSLNAAMQQAVQAVEGDIPGMVGREIVSYVAGEVLTHAGLQLATSAGILGAGASSGTVSFGAGIVIGMIVDQIVSWAYDEIYDPAGELSRQLDFTLLRLEELILGGDYDNPGLYICLHDYTVRRGLARNAAITSVVMPQTVSW
jgi:hypothetical protein